MDHTTIQRNLSNPVIFEALKHVLTRLDTTSEKELIALAITGSVNGVYSAYRNENRKVLTVHHEPDYDGKFLRLSHFYFETLD